MKKKELKKKLTKIDEEYKKAEKIAYKAAKKKLKKLDKECKKSKKK